MPGHWEGDLLLGVGNRSGVATVVERAARFHALGYLPIEHAADFDRESVIDDLARIPTGLRCTHAWDQGVQMGEHKTFAVAINMAVYFCEPPLPYQHGIHEIINGLLRQYLPKRSDLVIHEIEALAASANELNGRPGTTLAWDTPAEGTATLLDTT